MRVSDDVKSALLSDGKIVKEYEDKKVLSSFYLELWRRASVLDDPNQCLGRYSYGLPA